MALYLANPGYVYCVRDEISRWVNDRKVVVKPVLAVQFGKVDNFTNATDGEGTPVSDQGGFGASRIVVADFTSGLLDTDEYALSEHLDAEDKKAVEDSLLDATTNRYNPAYGDIQAYDPPKPKAPWSTFDNQTPAQIIRVAEETGFISEAIQYESLTKNRKTVMEPLTELLTRDEELTAA